MSEKVTFMGSRGIEKMPGWFSWRHQTREVHDASREKYLSEHGPAARKRRAAERLAAK